MEHGTAKLCALMGAEARVQILRSLSQVAKGDRGVSVSDLAEACGITISGTSQHLKALRTAGLVEAVRDKHSTLCRLAEGLPSLVTYALAYDAGKGGA